MCFALISGQGEGLVATHEPAACHQAACQQAALQPLAQSGAARTLAILVRKPVIYLYPVKPQQVEVRLKVAGELIAEYPKMNLGTGWSVLASPDGSLRPTNSTRRYPYLFWEAKRSDPFSIDPAKAYLVKSAEAPAFLERAAAAHGLNDKEQADFVSYWIGALQGNAVSLVQFLDAETYGKYAQMTVEPKPATLIRLFMVFKRATGSEPVATPPLPSIKREGFTVVEWGGSNLDESAALLGTPQE